MVLSIGSHAKVLDDVGVPQALQNGALALEVLHHLGCRRIQHLYRHKHSIPAPLVHL